MWGDEYLMLLVPPISLFLSVFCSRRLRGFSQKDFSLFVPFDDNFFNEIFRFFAPADYADFRRIFTGIHANRCYILVLAILIT